MLAMPQYTPQSPWESDAVAVVVFPIKHEEQEPEPVVDLKNPTWQAVQPLPPYPALQTRNWIRPK